MIGNKVIMAIYKEGDHTDLGNYSPISPNQGL